MPAKWNTLQDNYGRSSRPVPSHGATCVWESVFPVIQRDLCTLHAPRLTTTHLTPSVEPPWRTPCSPSRRQDIHQRRISCNLSSWSGPHVEVCPGEAALKNTLTEITNKNSQTAEKMTEKSNRKLLKRESDTFYSVIMKGLGAVNESGPAGDVFLFLSKKPDWKIKCTKWQTSVVLVQPSFILLWSIKTRPVPSKF